MNRPDDLLDDQEGDIADDPVLAALDRELGSVLRFTDHRLLVFIGIVLAAIYLPDLLHLPAPAGTAIQVTADAALLGAIAFTIVSAVRGQQRVAARYGLTCPRCRRRPRTTHIRAAAMLRQCDRCGYRLEVRLPAPAPRRKRR